MTDEKRRVILRCVIIVAAAIFVYMTVDGWATLVSMANDPVIQNDTSP